MKILAVLTALATIAIAAPTVEEYIDSTRLLPRDFTITQHRDKKSTPSEAQSEKISDHLGDHASEQILNNSGTSNVARTFSGLKKPIIVKKKIGYHAYRDSEEEQTQSDLRDISKKQVKLCDENNSVEKLKSASIDHTHEEISKSAMEHSINIAKEAVQSFERELTKKEHDCSEKNSQKQTSLASDAQLLHEDIVKARQALEHIHRKFKNLDSVAATVEEGTSNVHLKAVKSDEERMAKWKEAGNLSKRIEIAKNIEDNYKSSDDKDILKLINTNNEAKRLKDANNDFETATEIRVDGLTSIVQDKKSKMDIQSDSLIKGKIEHEDSTQNQEKLSRMEHHVQEQNHMLNKNADPNTHEIITHNQGVQENKERDIVDKDIKSKGVELKDGSKLEKHTKTILDNNKSVKSRDDSSATDNHSGIKLEKETQEVHLNTNDQTAHESKHVDTVASTNSKQSTGSETEDVIKKGLSEQNENIKGHLHHDSIHTTSLSKNTESMSFGDSVWEHPQNNENKKNIRQQIDLQRSTQTQTMPIKTEAHSLKNENGIGMDVQRSPLSTTISMLDKEKDNEKTFFRDHVDVHASKDPVHLKTTSDLHKELLRNMDFVEDSHHKTLHQPSLVETGQLFKNENPELHERLNVPKVQPNYEHLKTMMRFSDSTQHVAPHLKLSSMFDNDQPNFNVQFNSPQDFAEQTNVQELMPFRATDDLHDNMHFDERLKHMHDKDGMPTEMHDPLKVRWAHPDNMRMDGSTQHFNIEKLSYPRDSLMNDQHLTLNEQIRGQQRWAQAKSMNTHQISPVNTEQLHAHDSLLSRHNGHPLVMHEKSSIQPNSFTQMRGAPKMALEYTNPKQWTHNHGAFRTSYGPSMSASYGSGGGSSSGGSAVGVFPNANVGNCAVPLLLSCSPSVVSGSLAKTQSAPSYSAPSYNSPSYRSEDVNFLKKRGVNIDEVTTGLNLQRFTPQGHIPNVNLENNNKSI